MRDVNYTHFQHLGFAVAKHLAPTFVDENDPPTRVGLHDPCGRLVENPGQPRLAIVEYRFCLFTFGNVANRSKPAVLLPVLAPRSDLGLWQHRNSPSLAFFSLDHLMILCCNCG